MFVSSNKEFPERSVLKVSVSEVCKSGVFLIVVSARPYREAFDFR